MYMFMISQELKVHSVTELKGIYNWLFSHDVIVTELSVFCHFYQVYHSDFLLLGINLSVCFASYPANNCAKTFHLDQFIYGCKNK